MFCTLKKLYVSYPAQEDNLFIHEDKLKHIYTVEKKHIYIVDIYTPLFQI